MDPMGYTSCCIRCRQSCSNSLTITNASRWNPDVCSLSNEWMNHRKWPDFLTICSIKILMWITLHTKNPHHTSATRIFPRMNPFRNFLPWNIPATEKVVGWLYAPWGAAADLQDLTPEELGHWWKDMGTMGDILGISTYISYINPNLSNIIPFYDIIDINNLSTYIVVNNIYIYMYIYIYCSSILNPIYLLISPIYHPNISL